MNDYIKNDKKKRIRKSIIKIAFVLLIFIICVLAYYIYINIDVYHQETAEAKESKEEPTIQQVKEEDKKVSEVIEEVNRCVVGISKMKDAGESVFLQNGVSKMGLGTGIIVSENGYILTNEHVSGKKHSTSYITTSSGKTYKGKVVWSNSDIDMAIIKINKRKLDYAKLGNSDNIAVGESVYAIGNPIGYEFQRTVTSGIISALNRTIKLEENGEETYMEDLIQTDATINPGNSGGPLINSKGEVVGVNSVKITSAEGIGFAVPINIVKSVVESFNKKGKFEEARLGVFAYDTNVISFMAEKPDEDEEIEIKKENNKKDKGIYVTKVSKKTSAEKSGLRRGDIILSVDDKELKRMCELRCYIYEKNPKDEISLKVLRNNKEINIKTKLDSK